MTDHKDDIATLAALTRKDRKPRPSRHMTVVVDLQFGSTGKGLICGYLAHKLMYDTVVSNWGPNAGHTYIDGLGRKFVHTMLPIGALAPYMKNVLIGPGSIIDAAALYGEYQEAQRISGGNIRLFIHPAAAVVNIDHRSREASRMKRIGSTCKGTMEAVIDKMRRKQNGADNLAETALRGPLANYVCSREDYQGVMMQSSSLLVEGAQGYSLGINDGLYPYVTSRDCTVYAILTGCGVPANRFVPHVVGSCRTFPIRVANRAEGTSGPGYSDQEETGWDALGLEQEYTTVTKLPRRIFTWSDTQFTRAIIQNGVNAIFLNFMNYLPALQQEKFITNAKMLGGAYGARLAWLGWGPSHDDIMVVK